LSVEELRDYSIIVYCFLGAIVFFLAAFFTIAVGWTTWSITRRVRAVLKDSVEPTAENVKATAQNIRGTVEYVSDTTVKPVVTAYGMAAGARRFVGVVTRFTGGKKGA
jgi:hypothetical protein